MFISRHLLIKVHYLTLVSQGNSDLMSFHEPDVSIRPSSCAVVTNPSDLRAFAAILDWHILSSSGSQGIVGILSFLYRKPWSAQQ
jgi:hypothetical protein